MRARTRPGDSTSVPSKDFDAVDDVDGMVQSCCGIIDAVILEFDDVTPLDRWTEALDTLLATERTAADTATDPTAQTTLIRALLLRDAGSPRLADWLDSVAKARPRAQPGNWLRTLRVLPGHSCRRRRASFVATSP